MRNESINSPGKTGSRYFLSILNFYMLFFIFMIGSVAGFVIEGLWSIVLTGHWEHHAATIWGPFCIIYGAGAIIIYAISYLLRKRNIFIQFAAYLLAGSLVEYFFSLFQEICFGSVSWDYSTHFLNIGGRVSLKMTLVWGVLGILFAKLIFPHLTRMLMTLKGEAAYAATWLLIVFMAVNLVATCLTVTRWRTRQNDIAPENRVEQTIDSMYGDAKMKQLFPNMSFVAQENT